MDRQFEALIETDPTEADNTEFDCVECEKTHTAYRSALDNLDLLIVDKPKEGKEEGKEFWPPERTALSEFSSLLNSRLSREKRLKHFNDLRDSFPESNTLYTWEERLKFYYLLNNYFVYGSDGILGPIMKKYGVRFRLDYANSIVLCDIRDYNLGSDTNPLFTKMYHVEKYPELLKILDLVVDEKRYRYQGYAAYTEKDAKERPYAYEYGIPEDRIRANNFELRRQLVELRKLRGGLEEAFYDLQSRCISEHNSLAATYQRGMQAFFNGDYAVALYDILEFVDAGGQLNSSALNSIGESQHELGLYQEAIESMSQAIKLDPENEEAYLSRAMSYFELGDFEKSLKDYLIYSKKKPFVSLQYDPEFSAGFREGLKAGMANGAWAIPAFLSDACLGVWAFAKHPFEASAALGNAAKELARAVKEEGMITAGKIFIPEMVELSEQWDILDQRERAKQLGGIIGKYGVGALTLTGTAKAVKSIRKFKRVAAVEVMESAKKAGSFLVVQKAARQLWKKNKIAIDKLVAETSQKELPRRLAQLLRKQNLTEQQLRKALKRAKITPLPRPKGLPKDVEVKLSKKSVGFTYIKKGTTSDENIVVRVMPAKPQSEFVAQRNTYVVQRVGNQAVTKEGKFVPRTAEEAHIPLSEYRFRSWYDGK